MNIEQELQAKGLTAPRITPADIEANIASEHYFTAEDGVGRANRGQTSEGGKNPVALSLLTFCVLVLRNGFTVTGESACASPENFDAEIGRKIARANAVSKVWTPMGYALKERLAQMAAFEPYLKEGETPAERIERDHRDSLALMALLAQERTKKEALLEALHAMLSHTAMLDPSQGFDGFDHSAVNQARAAIAKAEGA